MPTDQTIEIELELQDKASATIQQIASSVSDVVKHLSDLGKASSGTDSGVARTTKAVSQLNEGAKETNKSMLAMSSIMARMAGPAGFAILIGTGLLAAAEALDKVAGKRLRFENLSTDLGISVDNMSIMIKTFQTMGMSSEEAKSRMIAIGNTLREIQTMGRGSEVYRTLSQMGRNEFAKQLVEASAAGKDLYHAFQMITEEFNRINKEEGPRAAELFLSTINGMNKTIAEQYKERSKGMHPARQVNKEVSEEFHKNKQDLKDATSDFINRWAEFFQDQSNKFTKMLESLSGPEGGGALGATIGGAFNMFEKSPLGDVHPFTKSAPKEPNSSKSLGGRGKSRGGTTGSWDKSEEEQKKEANSTLEKIRDSIKGLFGATPKQYGGAVEAGQKYLVGEVRPEIYVGGGGVSVVGVGGPQIFQPQSPGMISADAGGFPQFMPNMHTPQVDMPSFDSRFGNWNNDSFSGRFNDWSAESFGGRFGDWTTKGGGTRPTPGTSSPNWLGEPIRTQPNRSEDARNEIDVILKAESGEAPSLNAEVSFKNVPDGVLTKAMGDGFDNFRVNKSKALGDA